MTTPQVRMLLRDIERLEAELVEARAVVDRVRSALERTEHNLMLSINSKPVRDLAENLAENRAALGQP